MNNLVALRSNAPNYPSKLRELTDAPEKLYVKTTAGQWEDLINRPAVAVIGSRKLTNYGLGVTEKLVAKLVARGIVIVSGLALGIDAVAHKTAVECGGQTIAVLPSGVNHIYPGSHAGLANRIMQTGGALVSEYSPDEKVAFKSNFIARNRIIAGLADALLIPEAAKKSGSLHTANFGLDLGKEIFAVPGPINSPTSEGCNNLIKAGALMVTDVSDILQALHIYSSNSHNSPVEIIASTQEEQIIINLIISGITDADELLQKSNLAVQEFNTSLSMLEISGYIKPLGGNNWTLQ